MTDLPRLSQMVINFYGLPKVSKMTINFFHLYPRYSHLFVKNISNKEFASKNNYPESDSNSESDSNLELDSNSDCHSDPDPDSDFSSVFMNLGIFIFLILYFHSSK